jgi:UDP-glucose 4-epimerase
VRVLVTGATGFVGTAVAEQLTAVGHDVVAFARNPQVTHGETYVGDLLDRTSLIPAVAGVEAVCHLAALTRVRDSFEQPVAYFQANVTGTLNLLEAMAGETRRTGQAVRLAFASTGAVYGIPACQPISEDETPIPANPYGASKLAAEAAIRYQAQTGTTGSVVLRTFNVAGAAGGRGDHDQTRIIPRALAVAADRAERLDINGDGTAVREFIHVQDLARAYILALGACEPGHHRTYNVGSGIGVSVRDVVHAVRRITGRSINVRWGPPKPEPHVLLADSSRIRADLQWKPEQSDLDTIVFDAWQAMIT